MLDAQFESVEILSGWKEIATYLRKGVRTVQRYEREFGLPVRRPAGRPSGSVIATKAELDAWVAAAPYREVFRLSQASSHKDAIETKAILKELKQRVTELRQLRQESAQLRRELHESVELLRKNLLSSFEGFSSERRVRSATLIPSMKIQ